LLKKEAREKKRRIVLCLRITHTQSLLACFAGDKAYYIKEKNEREKERRTK